MRDGITTGVVFTIYHGMCNGQAILYGYYNIRSDRVQVHNN